VSSTRAKKSLGQNFLNAPSVVTKMLHAAGISKEDHVVEVGPGKGVLTKALLESGAFVYAYELDPRMVRYLEEHFSSYIQSGQLTIIQQDILDLDISSVAFANSYKVVANIPYYITNAIIRLFLSSQNQPISMTLLVQKEVASRIAQDNAQSILSLSVSAYGTPRYVTKVSRRYFSPQPKVDSAVIHISDISRENFDSMEHEQAFFTLVKQGFAHKRKHLASNLALVYKDKSFWQEVLVSQGYSATVRAQECSRDHFLEMARLVVSS
jgi:16S rRNA (adenine1518-N6/adenine1519-N6)-dimethyltransferase